MNVLDRDIAGATKAHRAVVATLRRLTDEQARQPSMLPGWTVGHVVTHIARSAEGHIRMFEAAARGEVARMYPGGIEGRAADIEAGSSRPAAQLLGDVETFVAELEATWAAATSEAWGGRGISVAGDVMIADLPFIRWREVIVHHADLGLDVAWSDWDPDYVRLELHRLTMLWASRKPMGLTELPAQAMRVDDHHRVAWLLGRAEIEGIGPAGIMV
jgi:maleylpyruvate isomerase